MDLEETKKIFSKLFDKVDGRALSLKGREHDDRKSKSFVYGEVVPDSFYELMLDINPEPGQVFYDLGSGTGKAVILAHLLFPFAKSKGIELLDTLYDASAQVYKDYQKNIRPKISKQIEGRDLEMIHGDILTSDLTDADVIFMNSTCFQDDLMEALEDKLESVHANAHIISLSKPLKSPAFHQYKHKMYDFSWGQATVFYHRKRLWKLYS
ncbi:MAG: SAM-dependent methyltransferase [Parachlamydiaceae bacterium]|nr:SAM-dependent methyltransferase [Parachlamydiaceae bacterium]